MRCVMDVLLVVIAGMSGPLEHIAVQHARGVPRCNIRTDAPTNNARRIIQPSWPALKHKAFLYQPMVCLCRNRLITGPRTISANYGAAGLTLLIGVAGADSPAG
jgi:hypothetical protein